MPRRTAFATTSRLRRRLFAATAGVALALGAAAPAFAAWPEKPITLVVPYAAGGFADTRMRIVGRKLSEALGQPVVIDNRAGAGGVLGTAVVAKAAPDGYTLGAGNLAPLAVNQSLMAKMPYDAAKDLAPVILVEKSPLILSVSRTLPVKNVAELIALAKEKPGTLGYGSSGVGGAHHLSGEMFAAQTGTQLTHVPYKGGAPAAADLMAGHLAMMFEMGYAALPSIKAEKIRPIAVTSLKRLAVLPAVPTLDESGVKGFESYNWQGIVVPAATPRPIIDRLNQALNQILRDPEVVKSITDTGSQPGGGTPEEFGRFIASETAKWRQVVQKANIKID